MGRLASGGRILCHVCAERDIYMRIVTRSILISGRDSSDFRPPLWLGEREIGFVLVLDGRFASFVFPVARWWRSNRFVEFGFVIRQGALLKQTSKFDHIDVA